MQDTMHDATASDDAQSPPEILALSLKDAARAAGLGKSALYEAIAERRLTARKFGRRTLVLKADLEAFLRHLPRVA